MPDPARPLRSESRKALIRSQLQEIVENHLPPGQDVDVTTERHAILRDLNPIFRQEAANVLLDEAIHGLILGAIHRRRSIFENKVTKSAAKFQEAKDAWVAGDSTAIGAFAQRWIVDKDRTMRPVSKMTRPDLLFVADGYDRRAAKEAMRASFFRLIASKLPDDNTLVEDVIDEGEYADLFRTNFVANGSPK